jgi:predicted DNA binding CopG/RHH family protein
MKSGSSLHERQQDLNPNYTGGSEMRSQYDFTKSVKNPYVKKLKKPISIRLDPDTISYFKKIAEETGIPYQNLMNHYLADCAAKRLRPELVWQAK